MGWCDFLELGRTLGLLASSPWPVTQAPVACFFTYSTGARRHMAPKNWQPGPRSLHTQVRGSIIHNPPKCGNNAIHGRVNERSVGYHAMEYDSL